MYELGGRCSANFHIDVLLYCILFTHTRAPPHTHVLLGFGLPLLHATFRSPNLKARLSSAREEFRAVW